MGDTASQVSCNVGVAAGCARGCGGGGSSSSSSSSFWVLMMAALDCVTLHANCAALNPLHLHALAQLHDRTFEAQERPMSAAHSSISTRELHTAA